MRCLSTVAATLFLAHSSHASDMSASLQTDACALPRSTPSQLDEKRIEDKLENLTSVSNLKVITCDEHESACLHAPSPPLTPENWELARLTAEKLLYVRNMVLKGGAGLAAPQIGINLPVFIYTPDRTTENLRVVVNPKFVPVGEEKFESYEACFSVPLRCTKIKRWLKIEVTYKSLVGDSISEVLDGFAAKVFQHEMDHIRGFLTIDHESADVISFKDQQDFLAFMNNVVKEDEKRYTK